MLVVGSTFARKATGAVLGIPFGSVGVVRAILGTEVKVRSSIPIGEVVNVDASAHCSCATFDIVGTVIEGYLVGKEDWHLGKIEYSCHHRGDIDAIPIHSCLSCTGPTKGGGRIGTKPLALNADRGVLGK